jgi:hypothetical protein
VNQELEEAIEYRSPLKRQVVFAWQRVVDDLDLPDMPTLGVMVWFTNTDRRYVSDVDRPLAGLVCVVVTFHRGWRTNAVCCDHSHDPRLLSGSVCGETTGQGWSRRGESNPGPAHYKEAAPRLTWPLPATTVAALTPLGAPAAPLDLSLHHV